MAGAKRTFSTTTEHEEEVANGEGLIAPTATSRRGARAVTPQAVEQLKASMQAREARAVLAGASAGVEENEEYLAQLRDSVLAADPLSIIDPGTGERRRADLKNPSDLEILAQTHNIMQAAPDGDGSAEAAAAAAGGDPDPADMRQRMIELNPDKLPPGVNLDAYKPMLQAVMGMNMDASIGDLNDITVWLPIIPVPVFASNLFLMLIAEPAPPTQDCMTVMRTYMHAMRCIARSANVTTRRDAAVAWARRVLTEGAGASQEQLAMFAAHAQVSDDSTLEIAELFHQRARRKLTRRAIRKALKHVVAVSKCEGAPWEPESGAELGGAAFAESILEENVEYKRDFEEHMAAEMAAVPPHDYDARLAVLYKYVFLFLHSYETTILRLFSDAATTEIIPPRFRGDFVTRTERPDPGVVHEWVLPAMNRNRSILTELRHTEILGHIGVPAPEPHPQGPQALPTPQEMQSFCDFLAHEPDDDGLVDIAERLGKRLVIEIDAEAEAETEAAAAQDQAAGNSGDTAVGDYDAF
jgi:hypothetical protein